MWFRTDAVKDEEGRERKGRMFLFVRFKWWYVRGRWVAAVVILGVVPLI